ncbi:MAG: helix-turn-helix domain-containing protein [Desulfobacterales bacterium]|nr:helix-turn-helix domain-containing protein [Desulfobacterales bacterium]
MERRSHFSQKQKLDILQSSKGIGIKESADLAGVHYSTVYQWQRKLDILGEEAFLSYRPKSRGRGIKKVTEEQEKEVLDTWERYPGFGPSQVRNQLRRQGR